jgi:probable F420-dependent oxidoreductase
VSVGISVYDIKAPDLLEMAKAADEAGFEGIWLGEHVFLPLDYAAEHPTSAAADNHDHIAGPIVKPTTELVDPLVALGAVAGATETLCLATGIYLLPLRHPLVTARAVHTLHEASGGRFRLGIGSGWLDEEFAVLGVPFDERFGRTRESVEIMRAAWAGGPFDYHGKYFALENVQLISEPVHVPIIMGGNSARALARAAVVGDGWYSSGTPSFDEARRLRDELHRLRAEKGLDDPFRCYFRIEANDPALAERYRTEGFDDVVIWVSQLWPATGTLEEKRAELFASAAALGLEPRD